MQLNQNLFIKVIELGLKFNGTFSYAEIIEDKALELEDWEIKILDRHFRAACHVYTNANTTSGETIFTFIDGTAYESKHKQNRYLINVDAQFKFLDYQELTFAKENAKEAKRISFGAIGLSVVAIVLTLIFGYWQVTKSQESLDIQKDAMNVQKEQWASEQATNAQEAARYEQWFKDLTSTLIETNKK